VYIIEGASQEMLDFLKKERAEVVIIGKFYAQALERAEEAVKREENAYVPANCSEIMLIDESDCRVMVPAYDDPIIWQGHASMIKEIAHQIPHKPDAIFCSVGGGGLLGGVLVGCKDAGWDDGEYQMPACRRNSIQLLNSPGSRTGDSRFQLFLSFCLCECRSI
jgi:L-serine/L-threonine ammonia-lyase